MQTGAASASSVEWLTKTNGPTRLHEQLPPTPRYIGNEDMGLVHQDNCTEGKEMTIITDHVIMCQTLSVPLCSEEKEVDKSMRFHNCHKNGCQRQEFALVHAVGKLRETHLLLKAILIFD